MFKKQAAEAPTGFSQDIYYRVLEDALPLIFFVNSVKQVSELPFSKIAYANRNFFVRMGINRDEMLNKSFRDFISSIFCEPGDVEKYFNVLLSKKRLFKMRVPLRPHSNKEIGNQYVEANSRVLQTEEGDIYVQGILSDATDYAKLSDSLDNAELQLSLLRREFQKLGGFGKMISKTKQMAKVFSLIENVAQVNTTVLVLGETGTGKEMIAKEIHRRSLVRGKFIPVNCGAFPEGLLESELFGHVRGAFTGADRDRKGLFRAASGGTIFLDEIGELLMSMQVKLLRVLEERRVKPLGSDQDYGIDVRVITATNQDLDVLVSKGKFREDLYYRLNVFPIYAPPLRERPEDIILLSMHFLKNVSQKMRKELTGFHPNALKKLRLHQWPGNIRELGNVIEYACVVANGKNICEKDILLHKSLDTNKNQFFMNNSEHPVKTAEKKLIKDALFQTGGNQQKAAEILGISRVTLWRKMKKLIMK